jgi:hypothetical protein
MPEVRARVWVRLALVRFATFHTYLWQHHRHENSEKLFCSFHFRQVVLLPSVGSIIFLTFSVEYILRVNISGR